MKLRRFNPFVPALHALKLGSALWLCAVSCSFAFDGTFDNVTVNQKLKLEGSIMPSTVPALGPLFYWDRTRSALRIGSGTWGDLSGSGVGTNSVSFGGAYASGDSAVAFHAGAAAGPRSFAMGSSTALGNSSIASGSGSVASGYDAAAFNTSATASGTSAFSMGSSTLAMGNSSVAMGYQTVARAYASLALGRYNVGNFASSGNTTWIASDPVFEVGIGTGATPQLRKNAVTVYKNGKTDLNGDVKVLGKVRIPATGGLSMGIYQAGGAPQ